MVIDMQTNPDKSSPHKKVLWITGVVVVCMFGFCFAMVPLYSLICKATGINPSFQNADLVKPTSSKAIADINWSRDITLQFVATNHMGMPWEFHPNQKIMSVHPDERMKVTFHVRNPTDKTMLAQAVPSMTPTDAIKHFHKIECFCFNQQALKAKEEKDMALIFYVDDSLPKEIHTITLAYTLFDVTKKSTTHQG
jgi:cytochrome c oxidase assembly protein subunit 11